MTKRRRKPENECRYQVDVTSWDVSVFFNEYAYINLFERDPFAERYYIVLNGSLNSTSSKKAKKEMDVQVVLHPNAGWTKYEWEMREDPIGDLLVQTNPKTLLARIGIPISSYELIRSYLTYKPQGRLELVGTEINRRSAKIFYIGFDSKKYEVEIGD
jgi:hypothetical protein